MRQDLFGKPVRERRLINTAYLVMVALDEAKSRSQCRELILRPPKNRRNGRRGPPGAPPAINHEAAGQRLPVGVPCRYDGKSIPCPAVLSLAKNTSWSPSAPRSTAACPPPAPAEAKDGRSIGPKGTTKPPSSSGRFGSPAGVSARGLRGRHPQVPEPQLRPSSNLRRQLYRRPGRVPVLLLPCFERKAFRSSTKNILRKSRNLKVFAGRSLFTVAPRCAACPPIFLPCAVPTGTGHGPGPGYCPARCTRKYRSPFK